MADGDKLTLGELQNSATSMTRLVGRVDDNFAFRVDQEGTGGHGAIMTIGTIHGIGLDSSAVRGYSTEVPPGGQPPVHPIGNGIGVEGKTGGGKGVHGAASADAGIGILAEHTGSGRGLAVKGRAGFSSCGSSTVAAGQASPSVNNFAVTATSHITVTPRRGAAALG